MKRIVLLTLMLIALCLQAFAAPAQPVRINTNVDKNASIAVMDLGVRPGAVPSTININGAGDASCAYLINRLVQRGCFAVVDKELAMGRIKSQGLKTDGLIDPDTAQRIGKMLGVKYLLYGNVSGVTVSDVSTNVVFSGVNVCTVKAHIIARIQDVTNGNIVMAIKGDGHSKSSYTKVAVGPLYSPLVVKIGTAKVTQDSVHNAVMKASIDAVDNIALQLGFGPAKDKKGK